jgi:hypothetical protein
MMTGLLMVGRADVRVIVLTPLPGIINLIVSVATVVLACRIAWRREPPPLSVLVITSMTAKGAAGESDEASVATFRGAAEPADTQTAAVIASRHQLRSRARGYSREEGEE